MTLFFNTFWIFLSVAVASDNIKWNKSEKKIPIHATLQNCGKTYCKETCRMISWYDRIYHHKTHFGIIVKRGTNIKITVSAKVNDLMFFCLSQSPMGEYSAIKLNDNKEKSIRTNFDCVPMISDSYNTKVTVTIKTTFWIELPIFKSNDVTSKEAESAFDNNVKLYGFVENTYTQMLLSSEEISAIKQENYSLNDGLLNQKKVLKYYDSLFGVGSLRGLCNAAKISPEEHTILFLMNTCPEGTCRKPKHSNQLLRIGNALDWLQPSGKSNWTLLTEFGHYYQIKDNLIGFGNVAAVWSMMFAVLFQRANDEEIYSMMSSNSKHETVVKGYQSGDLIEKWSSGEKLHFFLSLFEYGGDDRIVEEFHKRHAREETNFEGKVNIIPILVILFLEKHQMNILPYLEKVIDFNSYREPLIHADLEVLLVSGRAVMPALDFNLSPSDWSNMIEKRIFKQTSALTLFAKVQEKPIEVKFIISPFTESMRGISLYLNNKPHTINTESFALTIPRDVYSVYIAEKTYLSDVKHHIIATNDTTITIHVKEIKENDISSPLIYSSIKVKDGVGQPLLNVYINYKKQTISLLQLSDNIKKNTLYIQLRRGSEDIFSYILNRRHSKIKRNTTVTFEMNDRLFIGHGDPQKVIVNRRKLIEPLSKWRIFVFAENEFRHITYPEPSFKDKFKIIAKGFEDKEFLKIDVDYNTRIMSIKQTNKAIHYYFKKKQYFALMLERNNKIIYRYSIEGQTTNTLYKKDQPFEINDKLHIFHAESSRLFIGKENVRQVLTGEQVDKYIFLLTKQGILDADDANKILLKDNIREMENFYIHYNSSLQYNPLYDYHLNNFVASLRKENYTDDIPEIWLNIGTERPETTTQKMVTTETVSAIFVKTMSPALTSSTNSKIEETTVSIELPKQQPTPTIALSSLSSESNTSVIDSLSSQKIPSRGLISDKLLTNSTQVLTVTGINKNSSTTNVTSGSAHGMTETTAQPGLLRIEPTPTIALSSLSSESNTSVIDSLFSQKIPSRSLISDKLLTNSTQVLTVTGINKNSSTTNVTSGSAHGMTETTAPPGLLRIEPTPSIALSSLSSESNTSVIDSLSSQKIPSPGLISDKLVTNSTQVLTVAGINKNSSTTNVTSGSALGMTENTAQLLKSLPYLQETEPDLLSSSQTLPVTETVVPTEIVFKETSLPNTSSVLLSLLSNSTVMNSITEPTVTEKISEGPKNLDGGLKMISDKGLLIPQLVTNSTQTVSITNTYPLSTITSEIIPSTVSISTEFSNTEYPNTENANTEYSNTDYPTRINPTLSSLTNTVPSLATTTKSSLNISSKGPQSSEIPFLNASISLPHASSSKIPWYGRKSTIFIPICILSLFLLLKRGAF